MSEPHGTEATHNKKSAPAIAPQPVIAGLDAENAPANDAPSIFDALPDYQNIVQLHRVFGNRAVSSMLTKHRVVQRSGNIIQRLMSVEEFKTATYVKRQARTNIAKVDAALKKVKQTGLDMELLTELQDAIDHWLSISKPDSGRRPGVLQLRAEVEGEITKIVDNISKQSEDQPQGRQRSNAMSAQVVGAGKKYASDFSDFDSKQFRVSGRAPNRMVEEVKRTTTEDGKVIYYAMGLVTGYNGKAPVIAPYPTPVSLGDWYPQVTHINGMAVAPKSGIQSAMALQEGINNAIGGEDDVAMGQDAIDVLYTYSAQRGGIMSDLWDCIKGKVGVEDPATEKQIEIMLDAVHRKKRSTVSAHSRGTIKTDNAVKEAFERLVTERLPEVRTEHTEDVQAYWEQNDPGIGLGPDILAEISFKGIAENLVKEDMNKYIQVIYAGNAVQYPSSIIPPSLYAGGLDFVSMFVGSYTKLLTGAKSPGAFKGHGFVENYVPMVSEEIAKDVKKR